MNSRHAMLHLAIRCRCHPTPHRIRRRLRARRSAGMRYLGRHDAESAESMRCGEAVILRRVNSLSGPIQKFMQRSMEGSAVALKRRY